jgi:hypothetical protein
MPFTQQGSTIINKYDQKGRSQIEMERVDNVVSVKKQKDVSGIIYQLDEENFIVDR